MHDDNGAVAAFASPALHLFGYIHRHAGCMRLGPLRKFSGMADAELVAAINDLAERRWITIRLRPPRDREIVDLWDIERVTTTSFGRYRFPSTWSGAVYRGS